MLMQEQSSRILLRLVHREAKLEVCDASLYEAFELKPIARSVRDDQDATPRAVPIRTPRCEHVPEHPQPTPAHVPEVPVTSHPRAKPLDTSDGYSELVERKNPTGYHAGCRLILRVVLRGLSLTKRGRGATEGDGTWLITYS